MNRHEIGEQGETETANRLRSFGKVLRNLYLPDGYRLTQVDMILLNPAGVFVIENKNWEGSVYGSTTKPYWKVYYPTGEFRVQNPLNQNAHHVRAVEYVLRRLPTKPKLYNTVLFNDSAKLKTEIPGVYHVSDFENGVFDTEVGVDLGVIEQELTPYIDFSDFMREYHMFLLQQLGVVTTDPYVQQHLDILDDLLVDKEYLPRYAEYKDIVDSTRQNGIVINFFDGFMNN